MSPALAYPRVSLTKAFLTLGLSAISIAPGSNAWILEFWSGQADCIHKVRNDGTPVAADTTRSGDDHISNNCMRMSYDPTGAGIMAMRISGWTQDCAIALWSDRAGSSPCDAEAPYNADSKPPNPDRVFTMKALEDSLGPDKDGNMNVACITPLNDYVQSNSGFLGWVAYSCGLNAALIVEEDKHGYNSDQMESFIKTLTRTTSRARPTDPPVAPCNATGAAGATGVVCATSRVAKSATLTGDVGPVTGVKPTSTQRAITNTTLTTVTGNTVTVTTVSDTLVTVTTVISD